MLIKTLTLTEWRDTKDNLPREIPQNVARIIDSLTDFHRVRIRKEYKEKYPQRSNVRVKLYVESVTNNTITYYVEVRYVTEAGNTRFYIEKRSAVLTGDGIAEIIDGGREEDYTIAGHKGKNLKDVQFVTVTRNGHNVWRIGIFPSGELALIDGIVKKPLAKIEIDSIDEDNAVSIVSKITFKDGTTLEIRSKNRTNDLYRFILSKRIKPALSVKRTAVVETYEQVSSDGITMKGYLTGKRVKLFPGKSFTMAGEVVVGEVYINSKNKTVLVPLRVDYVHYEGRGDYVRSIIALVIKNGYGKIIEIKSRGRLS